MRYCPQDSNSHDLSAQRVDNSFSPDRFNDTLTPKEVALKKDSASLEDVSAIEIYPNPTVSTVTVFIGDDIPEGSVLELFDSRGKLLWKTNAIKGKNKVDLSNYAAGDYLLWIAGKSYKLMKQ